jgi:hypothetical protein
MPGERVTSGTSVDSLPLDVETISDSIDLAGSMPLSTSTRAEIDTTTNTLVGHLNALLAEPVWEGDEEALKLFQQAYRHLELTNRPTGRTPAFAAFSYMLESAALTKALVSIYAMKNGIDLP